MSGHIKRAITIPQDALTQICQRYHVHRLALFGSVLRDDFRPDSDVDVLVEFEPGHTPGLALIRMQDELALLFNNHPVDLVTPKFLNRRIREQVLKEMEIVYAQG